MSRSKQQIGRDEILNLESGLRALEASPEFRGPVEPLEGHESNDHLALVYESQEELFAAAVPFIRQGIQRGERCLYIADENSKDDVISAMRAGGIDVDAALESGALSLHTKQDTYLRNGEFSPDEMIDFLAESVDESIDDYEGLRIAGEMTWIFGDEPSMEDLIEYEGLLNELLPEVDSIALCQYNRKRFPAEVIRDVIRTHPHLVYDNTVCQNFYYTPPEEFFGPKQPTREVDRMMRMLQDRTEAKMELQRREQYLQRQTEITADPNRSFEEKLQALFELGCERFDLELGAMAHVDIDDDSFEVEYVSDDHDHFEPGVELPLSETYCTAATEIKAAAGVSKPSEEGYDGIHVYREFGIESYLGTYVGIEDGPDRTFFFVSSEPRDTEFSDTERTFLQSMGQWVKQELERQRHEQFQRELYETTADSGRSFDEKVERLLELGRERFDLDIGYLARTSCDSFEFVDTVGDHDRIQPGITTPLAESYCQHTLGSPEPLTVSDAPNEGWETESAYDRYGLDTYIGIPVTAGDETYGTLCFASKTAREYDFSDAERTFLELMGQWVSYELEREHREAQLGALTEMGQGLMGMETKSEIAESVVEHAQETLRLPIATVVYYDEQSGTLEPSAQTPNAEESLPTAQLCAPGSAPFWDAFVTDSVTTVDDVADFGDDAADLTSAIAVPLEHQGLFVTATHAEDGFSDAERDFVETTAATIEAACARADHERQLQEREQMLEEQNESLEHLNRINDIIRSIDQALVQASNRSEIETVVCEQLANVGPYELAWVGEHDSFAEEVIPKETAGTRNGYLDEISVSTGDGAGSTSPVARAVATGEPQVVNDILDDADYEPKRQEALNRGYHATVAIPLTYGDRLYGVLNVYAGRPGAFDELEQSVLTELADNIAYAINAVERKKALASNAVTELEFTVADTEFGVVDLIRKTGCEFSLESLVPRTDGVRQLFFTTRGAAPEEILEFELQLPVTDLELVSKRTTDDGPVCLFESELTAESFPETILEHGGRLQHLDASDESATITIHLAADADVREFTDMVKTRYEESELVAQRTREQSAPTFTEFHTVLTEELTDRQLEVLQTAYFNGYFQQPRQRSSQEIASTLDISQPTFSSHIRSAQRKLYRQFFEEQSLHD